MDGGVEVGGRVFDAGVQQGQFGQRLLASAELVARDAAAVAGEGVVQAEPELDQESTALLGLALLLVGQEAQGAARTPEKVLKIGMVVCSGLT